jgi:hypothetical protein
MARTLGAIIVILALIDGLVHLSLDLFVFHSFTRGLTSELFGLNFIGYVVLVIAFLASQRSSLSFHRLVDVVLIIYPLLTLAAWIYFTKGRGNPMGLAYISKPAEILLALAAIVYLTQLGQEQSTMGQVART